MRRRLPAIVLLLVLALPPLAQAATKQPVFGLRAGGNPKLGYFVYRATPGATRTGEVIVSNSGTAAGTVKLFAADATTGRTTGTVYLTDAKPKAVGSWIALGSKSLFLRPDASRVVRFTVRVPAGQKAGQWVGGIVAETSHRVAGKKSKQKASVQIRIRDLTIVAVQTNVPGAAASTFEVGDVKTGGQRGFQQVITHIANTGNQLVKPTGRVTVLKSNGDLVQTLPFKMDTFLPQTAIDYPLLLKKALAPGDYKANVTLSVPAVGGAPAHTVSASPTFSISKQDVQQVFTSATPQAPPPGVTASSGSSNTTWIVVAAIAGVVILAALAWLLLRRHRAHEGRPGTTLQPCPPAPGAAAPPPAQVEERIGPPPTAPETAREAANPSAATESASGCHHLWEVDYDRGSLGDDGVWRFPHRCSICGLELLASDVADATSRAGVRA